MGSPVRLLCGLIAATSLALAAAGVRADDNVAFGKPVTLYGTFGTQRDSTWPDTSVYPVADASTLVDGVFLAPGTEWQDGSVWWDNVASPGNSIVIDLLGAYTLTGLEVQADDNDTYLISYLGTDSAWHNLWEVPAVGGSGMQYRPDPGDSSAIYALPTPVTATALKFEGSLTATDQWWAVAEIKAFGASSVPEPGVLAWLLGPAVAGAAIARRRLKK